MNKAELIRAMAEKAGVTHGAADDMLTAFVDTVTGELKKGGSVQLVGFGSFEVKSRPARKGHNPATGETISIPAKNVVAFKPGKKLKDSVN